MSEAQSNRSPEKGIYADLRDKRVVITGGASGIGRATAERFVREGCKVVVLDKVDARKTFDRASGIRAVIADVSDAAQVEAAYETVFELLGGIDVLVANAGISVRGPVLEISTERWAQVMRTNLDGVFYCARAAALRMTRQGSGVILMTGSTNGLSAHVNYADYNASKAGIILLARTLARELAPRIRVNAVNPGYVMTPMQRAEYTDAMIEEVNQKIPLARHAEPEEVAALFAFLASSQASYITGQAIAIDGGETA